jgi:hypothetical protein
VNSKLSRRHLLKSIGTAGVASLVADVAATETSPLSHSIPPASRATNKADLVRLSSGRMIVTFDRRNGTLHRHHMFLPFDYRRATRLDDNDDVWEVGGTDDPSFGDPIFLVAKNSFLPSRDEVEKLEMFVSDCLFKYIQTPETYEIRASLYWKVRTPSSP